MYLSNMMIGEDNIRLDSKRPKPDIVKNRKKPDLLTHMSPYVVGKWTKEEENRFFYDSLSIENYIWYLSNKQNYLFKCMNYKIFSSEKIMRMHIHQIYASMRMCLS